MKTLANVETDKDVNEFIEAVPNKKRKADSKLVLEIIQEITGKTPKIWGVSIVGFGKYKYQRKNGEEYKVVLRSSFGKHTQRHKTHLSRRVPILGLFLVGILLCQIVFGKQTGL